MTKLDLIFEALANEHRRKIIYSVGLQPYSLTQLADMQFLSLPALYKHIKVLENAKMISIKKMGRVKYVTLKSESLKLLQDWLSEYHTYWGANNSTFKNYKRFLNGIR